MNYTPNDLQNITLKKVVFGGYKEDMVKEMLEKIIEDHTAYIHENIELKDKLEVLNEGMQHYKSIEDSLRDVLVVAQQTGEDIKKNAYEKAQNICREAELRAEKMVNDAQQEVMKINVEYEDMRRKLQVYKAKSEALLVSQLELLKDIVEEGEE